MIGVNGLFFFIVGYARDRNDLGSIINNVLFSSFQLQLLSLLQARPLENMGQTHLVGPLCSEVWQNKNRTSFSDFVKAYLPDMIASGLVLPLEAVIVDSNLNHQSSINCSA
jgi:hypothetical protein